MVWKLLPLAFIVPVSAYRQVAGGANAILVQARLEPGDGIDACPGLTRGHTADGQNTSRPLPARSEVTAVALAAPIGAATPTAGTRSACA